ncbi:MAG: alcohol dehydrogenase catalytic domain-containing protein [Chloroflexi bacterium]|nr:alcohol dehydrogenase catalytic domain-containing protein [Chloroflexota bacterium]
MNGSASERNATPPASMRGLALPGDRRVEFRDAPVPAPGPRQVLVRVRASSICGSDIRAIYREHLGVGAEAYQGVIAGHEPAGEVVEVGTDCRRITPGDRVAIYHIAGCGVCDECQRGYMIGCHDPSRAAYGWQRDGGHAEYLLAEEVTCLPLPDELSFVDGACVACGFGTAYEALLRIALSGRDRLFVAGLGPVGLAVAMLGRALGATTVVGVDISTERIELARRLGLVDDAFVPEEGTLERLHEATDGRGFEATIDCSGSPQGRLLALEATREWGCCAFVGEGGQVSFDVSPLLIHRQVTLHGSWVTSLGHMEELLRQLVRWQLHPEVVVTDRFPLERAEEAYQVADSGRAGKVCLVFEDAVS